MKVEKMKAEEACPSNIKQAEQELAETLQMLPNTKDRIETALEDLNGLMGEHEGNDVVEASEEWAAAKNQVEESTAFCNTI